MFYNCIISMIVFLLVSLCSCSTNLSTLVYPGLNTQEPSLTAFGDFYPQWAVLNSLNFTPIPSLKTINFYKNGSRIGTYTLQAHNQKIKGHFLNDNNSSRFFALDFNGIFRIYQSENFTLTFTQTSSVQDLTFTSKKTEIVYIMSSTNKMYKLSCTSYSIIAEESISRTPVKIESSGTKLIVYSIDKSKPNEGYISIYDENFTIILKQMVCATPNSILTQYLPGTTFSVKTNHTLNLQENGNFLIRTYFKTVQIWDIAAAQLVHNKFLGEQVFQAFICKNVLVIQLSGSINFYEYGTWSFYRSETYKFGVLMAFMKCFPNQDLIGVYSPTTNLTIKLIKFSINTNTVINSSSATNTSNTTVSQNSTQNATVSVISTNSSNTNITLNSTIIGGLNNSYINLANSTNNTLVNIFNDSLLVMKKEDKNQYYEIMSQIIGYSLFNQSVTAASRFAAFASASDIVGAIMRPFSSLLEEFVFYGYHSQVYSNVVELFTQQVDILNDLRIKPKFLNFKINSPDLDSENAKYLDDSSFQSERAPSSLYFIDFLKETALENIILVCTIYAIYLMAHKLALKLSQKISIFKYIYSHLSRKVLWWNFFLMLFSYNIRTFSFYCFAQLNIFVSYDFVDKLSMVFTVLFLFSLLLYTFSFYLVVYRFQRPRFSKQVLQMSNFAIQSYILEMNLNCVRGFSQSFVHGSFVNRHQLQLASLILIDISILLVTFRIRGQWKCKLMGILVISYLIAYLAFDVFLAFYSLKTLPDFNFDKTFIIIFFILIGITLLRMVTLAFLAIWQIMKQCMKSNRIRTMEVNDEKKIDKNDKKFNLVVQQIIQQAKFDSIQRKSIKYNKMEKQKQKKHIRNLKIKGERRNLTKI